MYCRTYTKQGAQYNLPNLCSMKEKILQIASTLREGFISTDEAIKLLAELLQKHN